MRRQVSGVRCQVSGRADAQRIARAMMSSYLTPDTRHPTPRSAVTLVELLITILIISILAGLILGVASVAAEQGREAKTRQMVVRLHNLLMEHYNSYKTRRVKLNPAVGPAIQTAAFSSGGKKGEAAAEARLYALREMMLMEVPDRWSDVLLTSVGSNAQQPFYLEGRTELANVYLRRYASVAARNNSITDKPNTREEILDNQSAECLYMIITLATGDGEARSFFHESNIGDVDGDGALEFLDGWGQPIEFLRWAPGFDSQIQNNANALVTPPNAWQAAAASDHDPYDVFRVDDFAFRLVPLIYSSGPDEDSGLYSAPEFVTWLPPSTSWSLSSSTPHIQNPRLSPYRIGTPPALPEFFFGSDISLIDSSADRTATDNIHNHLLSDRLKR